MKETSEKRERREGKKQFAVSRKSVQCCVKLIAGKALANALVGDRVLHSMWLQEEKVHFFTSCRVVSPVPVIKPHSQDAQWFRGPTLFCLCPVFYVTSCPDKCEVQRGPRATVSFLGLFQMTGRKIVQL